MRPTLPLVIAVASFAAVAAAEPNPDHAELRTQIVVISPTRLVPSVIVVEDTEAFGWLNYASRDAAISFPAETAQRMACRGPSRFRVDGPRLVADPVSTGSFATLCRLEAGEYDYRVRFYGAKEPLLGKLVVPAGSEADAHKSAP